MTTLRPLERADADAYAALVRQVFAALALEPPPSAGRLTGDDVRLHLDSGGDGLVAVTDTVVAGLLWAEKDGGLYVSRVAVSADCRRQGLATRLLAEAEAEAMRRHLSSLHLSTRLALAGNRRLFARCGLVEGTRHAHPGYAEPTFVDMVKRFDGVAAAPSAAG